MATGASVASAVHQFSASSKSPFSFIYWLSQTHSHRSVMQRQQDRQTVWPVPFCVSELFYNNLSHISTHASADVADRAIYMLIAYCACSCSPQCTLDTLQQTNFTFKKQQPQKAGIWVHKKSRLTFKLATQAVNKIILCSITLYKMLSFASCVSNWRSSQ